MGWMGLGQQKWISNQRSRKPFSKDRKPTHTSVHSTTQSNFTLARHKKEKGINWQAIFMLLGLGFGLHFIYNQWMGYVRANPVLSQKEESDRIKGIKKDNSKVYHNTLYKSAQYNIDREQWTEAANDLEYAMKQWESPQSCKSYAFVLLQLCSQKKQRCDEANKFVEEYLQKHPNDT